MDIKKRVIQKKFIKTLEEYNKILDSLTKDDLNRKSTNQKWTNREILFHMLLGFIVVNILFPLMKAFSTLPKSYSKIFAWALNAFTPIFNFLNALGAKIGGKIFPAKTCRRIFNQEIEKLIKKLNIMEEKDWNKGMYFPNKWDGLFDEYMTIEKLFEYPIHHFKFHLKQIRR